jgi:hypothetical protein
MKEAQRIMLAGAQNMALPVDKLFGDFFVKQAMEPKKKLLTGI